MATIVVNNYNYEPFLGQAIDSALGQTYPRTEVVVVDDGSTDASRSVISGYGKRVRAILKENGGQASALTAGFQASAGEVVVFLDADDWLKPNALDLIMPELQDPSVACVQWPLEEVDRSGLRTRRIWPRPQDMVEGDLLDRVIANGYGFARVSSMSGNAWSRRFLEQVMPIPCPGDGHGADGYLNVVAPVYGRRRLIRTPLSKRRIHGDNYSGGQTIRYEIERDLRRHRYHTDAISDHLMKRGIAHDPQSWERPGTYFAWLKRLEGIFHDLESAIPVGSRFVLVDEAHLGLDCLPRRTAVPFMEKDGRYWGLPEDSEAAGVELRRQRDAGAEFIAFVEWTFWWLRSYPALAEALEAQPVVLSTPDLLVHDLRLPTFLQNGKRPAG